MIFPLLKNVIGRWRQADWQQEFRHRLRRATHRFFGPRGGLPPRDPNDLGWQAENIAARFLRKQGYRVLVRRFAERGGEIDLICRHLDTLAFVEVRGRSSEEFGTPAETVGPSKQRKITRAAFAYLRRLGNPDLYFRFDIVEVDLDALSCRLIPNAFTPEDRYIY